MGGEHWVVIYSGRVRGVGFRESARRVAERFDVRGYVRNLSEGRVELVAEGSGPEVTQFLAAVREGMDDNIEGEETSTGGLSGFSVRR